MHYVNAILLLFWHNVEYYYDTKVHFSLATVSNAKAEVSACKMHPLSSTASPELISPNKLRALTLSSVEPRLAGDLPQQEPQTER